MVMEDVLRYARGADPAAVRIDGMANFHHVTIAPDGTRASLEAGINTMRGVAAVDGGRRSAILLRSSPWKAGQESNPWHDVFDLDHGYVRYFGDHKPSSTALIGQTRGNAALLDAFTHHRAHTVEDRQQAAPLALFRSVTVAGVVKGHVQFCGIGVIGSVERVVQRDAATGAAFPNMRFELNVLELARDGEVMDWRWIDDRRDPQLSRAETLRYAPTAWQEWVVHGGSRLTRLRRSVASGRIRSKADQQPVAASKTAKTLTQIYGHFDAQKHAFELLAARVTGHIFQRRGTRYYEGWITQGSGDGGTDFVGRLDLGDGNCLIPVVVLGQAKCISPDSSISAEQLARTVARLRRGWIGVFVTTGVISRSAQIEMAEDQYPILLVSGADLALYTEQMISEQGITLSSFLDQISAEYPQSLSRRRPEEVVFDG